MFSPLRSVLGPRTGQRGPITTPKWLIAAGCALLALGVGAQTVFINEIHYDDAGGDSGEGVEVAGPAGTDLTGWTIIPYNGSNGASYTPIGTLSGTIPDLGGGYGVIWVPITGLQNGAPDAVALVDAGNTVVQFLSYEGSFTATNGAANGQTSTDIGVSEPGNVEGQSLQLTGTGTTYTHFTWASQATATPGAFNNGQTFGAACGISLGTISTSCDALTPGVDTYDLLIPYTGVHPSLVVTNNGNSGTVAGDDPALVSNGTIIISNINEGDAYDVAFSSPCSTLDLSGSSPVCEVPACSVSFGTESTSCNGATPGDLDTYDLMIPYSGVHAGITVVNNSGSGTIAGDDPAVISDGVIVISGISELDPYDVSLSVPCDGETVSGAAPGCDPEPVVIINEVDYDNVGLDNAEWVELYNPGPVAADLTGYSVVAVNGANGNVQSTATIPAVTLAVGDYYVIGTASVPNVDLVVTGNDRIQNGPVDAVVLYNPSNTVVDAVSYEGTSIAPYVEGTGLATGDDNTTTDKVIARLPNGTDTNDNSVDWVVWCATPGTSNDGASDMDTDAIPDCLDACPLATDGIGDFNVSTCSCNAGYDPVFTQIGPNQVITSCVLSPCDIILGTPSTICDAFTPGTDTYTLTIPYTGVEAGVTVVNNSGSGTIGGDDPAVVSNGSIIISGISEANAYAVTLTAPCGAQVANGPAPVCEPTPSLVINEVDYNQPGTDADEYFELLNTGAVNIDLGGLKAYLWNGTGDTPYDTLTLNSVTLVPGDYYVLGSATVPNVDQVVFTTNGLQNGPDGIRLTTAGGTTIDQLSYDGVLSSTEGAPATTDLSNVAGVSLSRIPDGTDTNDNSADFIRSCSTPGMANTFPDADSDGTADCMDVCPGGPEPGTPCDDQNNQTIDDEIQNNCLCAGTPVDCEGVPGGPAVPGTPCDDLNPGTINDEYQLDCTCAGLIVDCLGIPGGPNLPGTPCNDLIPSTNDETWQANCTCVGTPCSQNVILELRSDANSDEISWEILYQNDGTVVCSGGGYLPNILDPIAEPCCLPIGCFRLRVYDSGGDGFVTGGYELRESGVNGRRIIDNSGNFTNGSVSAIANTYENGAFCVPIGDDKPIWSSCDKLDWVNNKFIVCHANAAVSAQYGVTNTTSGYEFWFFDPNGSYSFRRFRSHATSDGYGSGATRACHFKVNGWVNSMATPHIPANILMNVRVRGRVAGNNLPFGSACQFKIDAALAACPRVKLQDDPANVSDYSCGVSRDFGGASNPNNRIYANPPQSVPVVPSAMVRYQFRFRISGEGVCIVRPPQTSARMVLNWTTGTPLECSKTYEVDVRVSLDGGATWCFGPGATDEASACADTEDWGKVCLVSINGCNEMDGGGDHLAIQGDGTFTMYPNPNHGDQLFVSMEHVQVGIETVSVAIFDLTGKRVSSRTIAVQDGSVKANLDLTGELAGGLYLVRINAGDRTFSEQLVIQP